MDREPSEWGYVDTPCSFKVPPRLMMLCFSKFIVSMELACGMPVKILVIILWGQSKAVAIAPLEWAMMLSWWEGY